MGASSYLALKERVHACPGLRDGGHGVYSVLYAQLHNSGRCRPGVRAGDPSSCPMATLASPASVSEESPAQEDDTMHGHSVATTSVLAL